MLPPSAPHPSARTYLEMEDDRPYEPQGELGVAVCNVIVANVHQFHLKEKRQGQNSPSASSTESKGTLPQPCCPQGHPNHSGKERTHNTQRFPKRQQGHPMPQLGKVGKEGFLTSLALSI